MIHLTRLNHIRVVLNSCLIEQVKANPDTVISLTTGERFMVLESPQEIMDRVVAFRRATLAPGPVSTARLYRMPNWNWKRVRRIPNSSSPGGRNNGHAQHKG